MMFSWRRGSKLVVQTAQSIQNGDYAIQDQDTLITEELKPAPKLNRQVARIKWNRPCKEVYNHIRGLSPFPGAWTGIKLEGNEKEHTFKVFKAAYELQSGTVPGTLQSNGKRHTQNSLFRRYDHIGRCSVRG